ncbi:MAG TPA: glycosyltransferase family 39 protein, partial [Bacteroidales bacterium]|nr:glycosyltransferase family 39 protein [Bacteroidales bacterium]
MVKEFRSKCKEIFSTDHILLALILLAGGILRGYHWQEIPFTHDEFSALIRTQFPTFRALIEKGVMPDGHPAGVQVFLYYWTDLFGTSEWIVKLPFQVMGLLSVALIYKIGKTWFSATTGLVAAAFLSFLQFPVMYSQIARPYASGLFFSLLMVLCWTFVLFIPERKKILTRAGYVIAASLCTYNHHFSMLFAAMAGVTGLFF